MFYSAVRPAGAGTATAAGEATSRRRVRGRVVSRSGSCLGSRSGPGFGPGRRSKPVFGPPTDGGSRSPPGPRFLRFLRIGNSIGTDTGTAGCDGWSRDPAAQPSSRVGDGPRPSPETVLDPGGHVPGDIGRRGHWWGGGDAGGVGDGVVRASRCAGQDRRRRGGGPGGGVVGRAQHPGPPCGYSPLARSRLEHRRGCGRRHPGRLDETEPRGRIALPQPGRWCPHALRGGGSEPPDGVDSAGVEAATAGDGGDDGVVEHGGDDGVLAGEVQLVPLCS